MMKYILLSLFTLLHSIPIFIFNIGDTEINGNLTVLKNFYNKNAINLNSSCNLNSTNINFDGIFTAQSFGNIILNNTPECNLSDNIYLLGLDENKLIIKNSNSWQEKNASNEKIISNINGLNDNPLTFDSNENSIFIAPSTNSSVIMNCQKLSLNNLFGKETIFNNTVNAYNAVLLGTISCNTFEVNNGSIFIKSPITILAKSNTIETIESKNNYSVNVIQGHITVNNPINQIKGIIVSPIKNPSFNIICIDSNNQIKQTNTIMNFGLNTNTISNRNVISISNTQNITGKQALNFNTNIINIKGLGTSLNFDGSEFKECDISNTLSVSNQTWISRYITIHNSCTINSLNLPITFLINYNLDVSQKNSFSPNTYFLKLEATSTYSHYLYAKQNPTSLMDMDIFKTIPTFSLKNKNNYIIKKILYDLYEITKEIKNNTQNIKQILEVSKKEHKKYQKYTTEDTTVSETLTLLLHHYYTTKETISEKQSKEIDKILLQLSELESAL